MIQPGISEEGLDYKKNLSKTSVDVCGRRSDNLLKMHEFDRFARVA